MVTTASSRPVWSKPIGRGVPVSAAKLSTTLPCLKSQIWISSPPERTAACSCPARAAPKTVAAAVDRSTGSWTDGR
ncbi:hypothetical protein [Streptomyces sp. NPDC004050]